MALVGKTFLRQGAGILSPFTQMFAKIVFFLSFETNMIYALTITFDGELRFNSLFLDIVSIASRL